MSEIIDTGAATPGARGDDAILLLFRQWIAAHRRYTDAIDEAAEDTLVERANDLEMQIYRTPASGPVGLAIKGYFVGYITPTQHRRSPI